ncbi:hypothetical protein AU255_00405 [Methyloprofundus sedimenti]|uniref:Uncharacterized protein n=1 Tax=Methyloprofundus sedimenti TaxID=1420851 RepID=A0A1V8M4B2_9GAMM|nr:hypothetical protein [Methyloprofundus sedimenti]OQK16407.1 hypothetical protein AU255_00405 [Methyloprofundus sedimenti]
MTRYIWLFFLFTLTSSPVHSISTEKIPDSLQPWVNWVLEDTPEYQCPFFYNSLQSKYCAWPSLLTLDIQKQRGKFTSDWQVYNESYITLPGSAEHWPQNVTVNNKPALVISRNTKPAIKLDTGHYLIQGSFLWDNIPENLAIPELTGIISIRLLNKTIDYPNIKDQQLWFKTSNSGSAQPEYQTDQLNLQVFRKIDDSIPLLLTTYLSLEVSGKQREIKLPYALLKGFIPISLSSVLPARLEADGSLLVQVRPGKWHIELQTQHPTELQDLSLNINDPHWPASEIWSFASQPYLRLVEIEQVSTIDPSQSNIPVQWKALPAFLVKQGDTMQFKVIRRGDPQPEPNNLSISRELWLDFAGTGYTIQDRINGSLTHGWRLDSLTENQLGQVQVNGQTQLITFSENKEAEGIELRKGRLDLRADSRVDSSINQLSATGWQEKFNSANAILHLPPGWHLFAISGVDNVPNSWITRWTLLDLFLVLIAALAVSRLWNNYWGLFALFALALIWHEANAPRFIWLNILVAISLIKVLPQGNLLRVLKFYRAACWLVLLIICIPFLVEQVRTGLYPQLEKPWQSLDTKGAYQASMVTTADGLMREEEQALASSSVRKTKMLNANSRYYQTPEQTLKQIDPNASLQTGPGLPQWQWTRIPLSWNGSIDSQQQIRYWYIDPTASLLLNFLRVVLIIILSLLMFGIINQRFTLHLPKFVFKLGLFIFFILPITPVSADFPSPELLMDLKQRLLKAPDCLPSCAQLQAMQIDITADRLALTLQANAQQAVAIPLPAQFKQWLPHSVLVDGSPAKAIIRDERGFLWLTLTRGMHTLVLSGAAPLQSSFTLPLPLKPHYISHTSQQWEIEGLKKNGTAEDQLHFTRVKTTEQNKDALPSLDPSVLPAFLSIERTLNLGLDWYITTRVIRASKEATAVTLEVPLLKGESISTSNIRSEKGVALVQMTANQQSIEWHSLLEKSALLTLTAPDTNKWSEIWQVNISPIWHIKFGGIPAVHHQDQTGNWLPEWRPWPGESITLSITRPEAVQGQTLTIDKSTLQISSGKRNLESSLDLDIRSSKGTQHNITLPENALLQSVSINGKTQPIRQQQRTVTLPVNPGSQHFQLNWHEAKLQSSLLTTPTVSLGIASVNTHLKVLLAEDRWVLLTFGPKMGPAVLFWGVLIVLAILAYALGKSCLTPLRHWQWFLLLIGLSQIPLIMAFVVVAWLMALGLRQKQSVQDVNSFNLMQILLIALTIGSLAILFIAVEQGLLGSPDMQIAGNQSTAFQLNWYQDRSLATLPTASVISVPLMSYRIMMLIWSLWLAISLLNWLKWGWQCFSYEGLWKKSVPKTGQNEPPL